MDREYEITKSIIALYFARNERAIAETDRVYGKFCLGLSEGIVGNHADAEECVNDTYIKAWNTIPPKEPPSLKTYLAKIIRNLSIDRYRQNRAAKKHIDFEIALHELSECLPAPAEAESDLIPLMETFLRGEDELSRKLFMGRYWHACSVKALAQHYGLTPSAVTKRLTRTREKLRVYLTERGYQI